MKIKEEKEGTRGRRGWRRGKPEEQTKLGFKWYITKKFDRKEILGNQPRIDFFP